LEKVFALMTRSHLPDIFVFKPLFPTKASASPSPARRPLKWGQTLGQTPFIAAYR
jgi:hypothetical protein